MYKNQDWSPYASRKVKIIELNLKDCNGQTVDFYKLDKEKTLDTKRILKKIKEVYGFDLNERELIKEKDNKKVNWLNKNVNW